MGDFSGLNAIVTGGGSGIGLAITRTFLKSGANVLIMGRNQDRLDKAVAELSAEGYQSNIRSYQGDVGKESDVAAATEAAALNGKLDIAVANAGTGGLGPILGTEGAEWDQIMQTNVNGTFYTIKHAGKYMASSGGGAICAISSIAGIRTHRYMAPYCVSKASIDMLVRNSADELGQNNIRVNSVCPGLVDTEIAAGLMATGDVHEDYLDCMPLRRTGHTSDIANAVQFLCHPASGWITGVSLSVDGGHHLRRGPNVESLSKMIHGHS